MQILRRHFSRYTPEAVASVCGCAAQDVERVAGLLCDNSGRERTSAIVYAVGWTQHTTGVQVIRAAGILQMLLGNIGRPGGGVMAMRGHASIQGSTDVPTLYDLLPGYLPQPTADGHHDTLDSYVEHEGLPTGYWANFRKFIVSLLKSYYGDAAQPENGFRYGWLPRIEADHSQMMTFGRMARGEMRGYILLGQNPGGGGPNAKLHRAGLRRLDWLVVRDLFETESASFWKNDPAGPPPSEIKTEVFFLPAAAGPEKEGTLTNTQRLLQWHDKAVEPPGDCRSDAEFVHDLGKRLKALHAGSTDPKDQPLLALAWDYEKEGSDEPDIAKVLMELNGHDLSSGTPRLLAGFADLKDDGSTACGCWIYSGVFPAPGRNRARERKVGRQSVAAGMGLRLAEQSADHVQPGPRPTRRAGPGRSGRSSCGGTRPRAHGPARTCPTSTPRSRRATLPPPGAKGMDALPGTAAFIMKPDGMGWLYAPALKDGPVADALRTGRIARGQRAVSGPTGQPGGAAVPGAAQPDGPCPLRGIPRGGDDLPPDRALPERADEPVQRLAQRAAAGHVRGAGAGACRDARHRAWRLGDDPHAARSHRVPGHGHAPPGAAARGRPDHPPDRLADPLGLRRRERGRGGRTTSPRWRPSRT